MNDKDEIHKNYILTKKDMQLIQIKDIDFVLCLFSALLNGDMSIQEVRHDIFQLLEI